MARPIADNLVPILGIIVALHAGLIILYIQGQQYSFALANSIIIILLLWVMYRAVSNQQSAS